MLPTPDPPETPDRMTRYHASWVVPISSAPIRRGWVDVANQRIIGFGSEVSPGADVSVGRVVDLSGHVLLPALVNAHTHLELSSLRGRVSPDVSMPSWARRVMAEAAEHPATSEDVVSAVEEVRATGTGLVGDISNTLTSLGPLVTSQLDAVVFKEFLGFDEEQADTVVSQALHRMASSDAAVGPGTVRMGLAAHAPYSVSPALFRAIRSASDTGVDMPISVHLAESVEELEFLRTGQGAWRAILEERGRWDETWRPSTSSPVEYLRDLGWMTSRTIVVHGVHLTDAELESLADAGVTLVTCPRSNQWTGAGVPPVDRFYASGITVAIGTDSLASAPDLNVFAELAEISRLAPSVPASTLLRSATRVGAEALGFRDRGAIEPGLLARLIAVRCPESVDDVEQYLVRGVEPELVAWPDHM